MDWKALLFRLAVFLIVAISGGFMFAVTVNLLIKFNLVPEAFDGRLLAQKATYIYMASIVLAFISVFIKQDWRKIFLFSPVYAPCLFAIIYTVIPQ